MASERTAAEIERDLARARQRLAENLSQLVSEIHPNLVVQRTIAEGKRQVNFRVEESKRKVRQSVALVKGYFKDESGWKASSLAVAGAVAAGLVVVVLVAKKK